MDTYPCTNCKVETKTPEALYCDECEFGNRFSIILCLSCFMRSDREDFLKPHEKEVHSSVDIT